jgi:hypothetical protein
MDGAHGWQMEFGSRSDAKIGHVGPNRSLERFLNGQGGYLKKDNTVEETRCHVR